MKIYGSPKVNLCQVDNPKLAKYGRSYVKYMVILQKKIIETII